MRCNKTFDVRTLSHQALGQVRRSAVQRVEAGESPEFVGGRRGAQTTDDLPGLAAIRPLFIEPWSPWENGNLESYKGKLRDEWLKAELFDSPHEGRVIVAGWR